MVADQIVIIILVLDVVALSLSLSLSLSVVHRAAANGAGGADLRNRAVRFVWRPRWALLVLTLTFVLPLSGWGSSGETDTQEKDGAEDGELHGDLAFGNRA